MLDEAYAEWQADPNPERMGPVIAALEPTLNYALSSIGASDNPQMKHQARIYAADAVGKYDPNSGASLKTWVGSQMQRMKRYKRENAGAVKVPDRARLDAFSLEKARERYLDENGKEPDLEQLSDFSGMTISRIEKVRKQTRPVVADGAVGADADSVPDYNREALDYVYQDSSRVNRNLIEMITGYGGAEPISQKDAAAALGISPAQVNRRMAGINLKVHGMLENLEESFG